MEYTFEKANEIAVRNYLIAVHFDSECIYCASDLSNLVKMIADTLVPGNSVIVTEKMSEDGAHYVATMRNGSRELTFTADATSDWLPDYCFEQIEKIPEILGEGKVMYMINPAVGLTGQDALYYYGWEADLKKARTEELPLIYPNEDITETPEFKMSQLSYSEDINQGAEKSLLKRIFVWLPQQIRAIMRRKISR